MNVDEMKTKKAREDMEKLLIGAILSILSYGSLTYFTNWKVSLAVFVAIWANNITIQMRLDSRIDDNNKVVATGIANLIKNLKP